MSTAVDTRNVTSADPAMIALTPLSQYITQARSKDLDEQLCLLDEIAACRGMLPIYHQQIDKFVTQFNDLTAKDPHDKEAARTLVILTNLSNQLLEATSKFSRVVKSGAEIELIRATRLDSVQLLHVLSQIPQIISSIVEITLSRVIEEIRTAVESHPGIPDSSIKEIQNKIPYFSRTSKVEIASRVNEVVESLDSRLKTLSVPHDRAIFTDGADGNHASVTEEQVAGMISCVPVAPSTVTSETLATGEKE